MAAKDMIRRAKMKKIENEKLELKKPVKKEESSYKVNEIKVTAYGECYYGFSGYYISSEK